MGSGIVNVRTGLRSHDGMYNSGFEHPLAKMHAVTIRKIVIRWNGFIVYGPTPSLAAGRLGCG